MTTKEERPWPRRAPPDASAGYNMFTGQRSSLENNEGTSGGPSWASSVQGIHGEGNGDKMWSNRLASADFNIYNNSRNSMGTDGYISFGAPMNQDGSSVPVDGASIIRQISGRPPLDPLLIPRSQANSLAFDGVVPLSARRGSPLRTATTTANSFTPSSAGSPSLAPRRRASAPPVPAQPSNLSRSGSLQPRVPSSPNTSPWHGRISGDLNTLIPRSPSPSDQHVNSSNGYYTLGTPSHQVFFLLLFYDASDGVIFSSLGVNIGFNSMR